MSSETNHYFFAVPLPLEVKQQLFEQASRMNLSASFKEVVHLEDYHITLAFLGGIDDETRTELVKKVKQKLSFAETFSIELFGLGVFGGNQSEPRVIWADMKKEEKLDQLREIVYNECTLAGLQLEKRTFTPHITLAKKWVGEIPRSNDQFKQENERFINKKMVVDKVCLYKVNRHQIPKYECIVEIPLA